MVGIANSLPIDLATPWGIPGSPGQVPERSYSKYRESLDGGWPSIVVQPLAFKSDSMRLPGLCNYLLHNLV